MIAALLAALMGAMSSVFNRVDQRCIVDSIKSSAPRPAEKQLVTFGRHRHGRDAVLLGWLL